MSGLKRKRRGKTVEGEATFVSFCCTAIELFQAVSSKRDAREAGKKDREKGVSLVRSGKR